MTQAKVKGKAERKGKMEGKKKANDSGGRNTI
jgi:hypothetical protein